MKYLNPKKLKELINFKPHASQTEILTQMRRFTILNAGRRFGKTILCSYVALKYLLLNRKNIWVCAPTYDLAKKEFSYLTEWINRFFEKGAFKVNFSDLSIRGANGSVLTCKSAENPTGLLGQSLDLLIIDEFSRVKKEIWESYLRPSLSDREGKLFAISTPVSKENHFYSLWARGQDPENEDWISFTFPSTSNPYLSKKDLKEAKETLPKQVWDREYMAMFLDSAYSVFRNVKDCISPNLPRKAIEGHRHIIGIDLAKQIDYSVISVVDKETNELIYIDRFSKLPYTLQQKRIINTYNKFPHSKIIVDSGSIGGSIIDELRLKIGESAIQGYSFTGTISKDIKKKGSKERLIEHLAQFIESKDIRIPDDPVLINELESFGVEISESGNMIYGSPTGMHDDCVCSLALAVWGLKSEDRREKDFRIAKREQERKIKFQSKPRSWEQYR